jgi:hypothetical protein
MNENSEFYPTQYDDATEQRLRDESYGDVILFDLLLSQEDLRRMADPSKGHDRDELNEHMRITNEAIANRKRELGIPPDQEP